MKKIAVLAISFLALCSASVCRAADATYNFSLPIGPAPGPYCVENPGQEGTCAATTITGYIETDGKTGTLTAADIVDWNLQLTVAAGTVGLTKSYTTALVPYGNPPPFGLQFIGTDPNDGLSATPTQLKFDFSGPEIFIITSGDEYDPFSTTLCFKGLGGGCSSDGNNGSDSFQTYGGAIGGYSYLSGVQVIGTASGVSVPEGGATLVYLLLAAVACSGAFYFKSRNRFERERVAQVPLP